ncbi:MAG: AAA family ATPase [Acidimicrobiales bacterium]
MVAAPLHRFSPAFARAVDPTSATDRSVLVADLAGFTAISERLGRHGDAGGETLVHVLNRVLLGVVSDVADLGGDLAEFGGDSLVFLFDGEGHASRAASAAVTIRRSVADAQREATPVGRLDLSVSIGVDSGPVDIVVPTRRATPLLFGLAVDGALAAEAATTDDIVIGPRTAAALPGDATDPLPGRAGLARLRWRRPRAAAARAATVAPELTATTEPTATTESIAFSPSLERALLDGSISPSHRIATIAFLAFDTPIRDLARSVERTFDVLHESFDPHGVSLLAANRTVAGFQVFAGTGVPAATEDDTGRLLRAVAQFRRTERGAACRVGIARGPVFAAVLGDEHRAVFSAMGDTTNVAARLAAAAPAGEIWATPRVLSSTRTRWRNEPLAPLALKGKRAPVAASRVLDDSGESRWELDPFRLPFTGRTTERSQLESAIGEQSSEGGTVLVVGAPGVGKSRLVAETVQASLFIRGEPERRQISFGAVAGPLRRLLDLDADIDPAEVTERVAAVDPALAGLAPLLGDVLQIRLDDTAASEAVLDDHRLDRTLDVVTAMLDHVALDGPPRLVVDDLQWLDDTSRALVDRLGTPARSRPWVVVATSRDAPAGGDPLPSILDLEPLEADAVRSLAVEATATRPLREVDLRRVIDRSAGNPAALGGLLLLGEVGAHLDEHSTVSDALAAQFDALDPWTRTALERAAVLGRTMPTTLLEDLAAADGGTIVDAGLVDRYLEDDPDTPGHRRFRNALLRDVIYQRLSFARRRLLHRLAADALEQAADSSDDRAIVVARHRSRSDDPAAAFRACVDAASTERRSIPAGSRAEVLRWALEAAGRMRADRPSDRMLRDLWTERGDAEDIAGLLEECLESYERAMRRCDGEIERAEVAVRRMRAYERAGRFPTALAMATRIRRRLAPLDEPRAHQLRAEVLSIAAVIRQLQGRAEDAWSTATRADAEAVAADDDAARARALGVLAWSGFLLGRGDTERQAAIALQRFEEVGDAVGQARMANNLGVQAYFRSEWTEAAGWYRRSGELSEQTGAVIDAAIARINEAELLVSQRRHDEAEPILRDAVRRVRASGHWASAVADMHLGRLLTQTGAHDEALERLQRAVETAEAGGHFAVVESRLHLALALCSAGEIDDAQDLIDGLASMDEAERRVFAVLLERCRLRVAIARDDLDGIDRAVRAGIAAAAGRPVDFELAMLVLEAVDHTAIDLRDVDWPQPRARAVETLRGIGVIDLEARR